MDISRDIKQLISDGKTQQALDLLQENLQGKNDELLNQTYLLESQYKDLQQKIRLGIADATAELNRINFSLLSICDEIKKNPSPNTTKTVNIEKTVDDTSISKTLLIFGIIAVVATALILFLVFYFNTPSPTGK